MRPSYLQVAAIVFGTDTVWIELLLLAHLTIAAALLLSLPLKELSRCLRA